MEDKSNDDIDIFDLTLKLSNQVDKIKSEETINKIMLLLEHVKEKVVIKKKMIILDNSIIKEIAKTKQ